MSLSQVAPDYPELSWAEAFTAAKLIGNGTGWHVGAMVGSPDFIGDIKEVKGKTDAGFVAPMAAGVVAAFEDDQESIDLYREMYRSRLSALIRVLSGQGMRLALEPAAGFFTLWLAPSKAFGRRVESAERFNFMMIEETGVVGVHFPGYVRYAVLRRRGGYGRRHRSRLRPRPGLLRLIGPGRGPIRLSRGPIHQD